MNQAALAELVTRLEGSTCRVLGMKVEQGGELLGTYLAPRVDPTVPQLLFSGTKSFTALAAGLAVTDGALRLYDRLGHLLPEVAGRDDDLADATVEDLLTMRSGRVLGRPQPISLANRTSWLEDMLLDEYRSPGENFKYDCRDSHLLSIAVQRATGVPISELLRERVFNPMGFGAVQWPADPNGYATGSNYLRLTLNDFHKWGQLHRASGYWAGEEIIPNEWLERSRFPHVDNERTVRGLPPLGLDLGYGYQTFTGPDGSFMARGSYGQLCLVLPAHDAIVTVQASALDELRIYWSDRVYQRALEFLGATPEHSGPSSRRAASLPVSGVGPDLAVDLTVTSAWIHLIVEDSIGCHRIHVPPDTPTKLDLGWALPEMINSYRAAPMPALVTARQTSDGGVELQVSYLGTPFSEVSTFTPSSGALRWVRRAKVGQLEHESTSTLLEARTPDPL